MAIEERIDKLLALGDYLDQQGEDLAQAKIQARMHNKWFTPDNVDFAISSIRENMLRRPILSKWVSNYEFGPRSQKVGLILAGNIPLVGFHDIISCYLAGHKVLVKTSSKDSILTLHLLKQLGEDKAIEVLDRLSGMDAVIATGSNHSAKQFERYFEKYPRIIRRNRNAVAVLSPDTSETDLLDLGEDVFRYFGLGCRNVSKVYLPIGFNKPMLMEVLHDQYKHLVEHVKYKNNYDYNHAVYLLNQEDFLASGAVLLRRNKDIISRIACLHYEEYGDTADVVLDLKTRANEIQCVSSNIELSGIESVNLGACQKPKIHDYADGVDTMDFLSNLSRA